MSFGRSLQSAINITPYIDILLVLLIIFMVMQPREEHQLQGRIPAPASSQPVARPDLIVLTISSSGKLTINHQPVKIDHLGEELLRIYAQRVDKNLFINGAPGLAFGSVVNVIDIAKGVGVADVGLMADDAG